MNRLSAMVVVSVLACLGGNAAIGADADPYLKGTYVMLYLDSTPQSDQLTLAFDGAGNFSGTDISNSNGTITTNSLMGTYAVAPDGSFTAESSGGDLLSGHMSPDGNVLLLTKVTSGENPALLIAVRQGLIGSSNVAAGISALASDTTGTGNSAVGDDAMTSNASGVNNTAFGANALYSNTTGKGNAAQGVNALYFNTTGSRNLGIGSNALYANTVGSYNIGLGFDAGYNVTTGSNNIEIGAPGTAADNDTIQIGSQGTQTKTTIAGIYGTTLTGSAVYVTSAGQLGVLASSERFKTDVTSMGDKSAKLADLRPVTFKLKSDAQGTLQYGLIAEEVAKVYPELVIRGADGRIDGVRYEELTPMLLNQLQQQRQDMTAELDAQRAVSQALSAQSAAQAAEIDDLKRQMSEMRALIR